MKKVFLAFGLMEGFKGDDGYFDHTGLIYDGRGSGDPGVGVRKLGYYTYRKMTEKLEGADRSTLTVLRDGTLTDHVYRRPRRRGGGRRPPDHGGGKCIAGPAVTAGGRAAWWGHEHGAPR